MRPGHRYGEEIISAIQSANAVILVLTENANTSKFVEREIERAVSYGKPTLPVRVREVQPSRSLELFISDAHWIDAWTPPMEQYLDRLADSIRTLSPSEGESVERHSLDAPVFQKRERNSGRRLGLAVLLLLIIAALAGAAWWLWNGKLSPLHGTESTVTTPPAPSTPARPPEVTPSATATSSVSAPSPPPVSAVTASPPPAESAASASPEPSPTARPATPEPTETPVRSEETPTREANRAVADVLAALGNLNGMARYSAIREQQDRLPAQISVEDLLALTRGTSRRSDTIQRLFARLPGPLPVGEVLKVLGSTSGMERYGLIRLFAQRLPAQISVDELLNLIDASSRRSDAIGLLVSRLRSPLPVEEVLRILESTNGMERYGLIRLFAQRLPGKISVDQLLTLVSNASRRSDAVELLSARLPSPIPVQDLLRILASTNGMERYGLIRHFAERLPGEISVAQLLDLISGASRRNDVIGLLAKRLHTPLTFHEMSRLLGSASGIERYTLIRILAPRAPSGLSPDEVSTLVQGSSRAEEAKEILRRH